MKNPWWVYVIKSKTNNRTYVGITTNITRRLRQHNGEIKGGAKATRGFRPWDLLRIVGPISTQKKALKEERRIKRLRKRRFDGSDKTIYEEKYAPFNQMYITNTTRSGAVR